MKIKSVVKWLLLAFVVVSVGVLAARELVRDRSQKAGEIGTAPVASAPAPKAVARAQAARPAPAAAQTAAPATTSTTASATAAVLEATVKHRVIAFYFHGTYRCHTCLTIEAQAKAALEEAFPAELKNGTLVFRSVNFEQPENAHYATDYHLPTRSLVLSDIVDGREKRWQILGQVWQLVWNQPAFAKYVQDETRIYLEGR